MRRLLVCTLGAFVLAAVTLLADQTDNFNRTETPVAGYDDIGDCGSGFAANGTVVNPTQAYASEGEGGCIAIPSSGTFATGQFAEIKITDPADTGDESHSGPVVNMAADATCGYEIFVHAASAFIRQRTSATATTDLDSESVTNTAGVQYTWRLTNNGSGVLTGTRNGSAVGGGLTATNTDCTGGKPGWMTYSGDTPLFSTFDDFVYSDAAGGAASPLATLVGNPRAGGGGVR